MKIKCLYYLACLPTAFSAVTFRIIVPKGIPSVIVNNKSYLMKVHEYPVYKIKVEEVSAPVKYSYSVDYTGTDEESKGIVIESFERTLDSGEETLNEYFERQINTKIHPLLPKAYESYPDYVPSKLYDDTHVATIIINGKESELKKLHNDPTSEEKVRGVEVIYATPYSVRSFKNATIGIAGQTTVYAAKLSYSITNLKDGNGKELYKRTGIKLRAEHMDPSFLRDKIYTDLLNSLGVPTPQNKFARVFINGQAIGLYDVSDKLTNKRYLRETLNKGEKFSEENPIYKADYYPPVALGDLGFYSTDPYDKKYGIYYYKGESMDDLDDDGQYDKTIKMNKKHLIPFFEEIRDYPQTKKLNMDIKMFLKFMAMEFMAGGVDNYWSRPGNFYIYKNMKKNGQWLFLDSDFHFSFGAGGSKLNKYLAATIDNYASINKDEGVTPSRPPLDNLRTDEENEKYFKSIFIRLINSSFHVDALFPRIDSLAELIREDVAWDFSLPRISGFQNAEDFKFVMKDFEYQISNEKDGCEKLQNLIPLRCWIRNKGLNIASQLGVQYPEAPDRSLGEVETLVQTNKSNNSTSSDTSSLIIHDDYTNIEGDKSGANSLYQLPFIACYLILFIISVVLQF